MDDYENKYFVFALNNPWVAEIYGREVVDRSGVLFQKKNDILIPVGEDTIYWRNGADYPPSLDGIVDELMKLGIEKIFITSLENSDGELWGLCNLYAPEDYDYSESPPDAEIYYALRDDQKDYFSGYGISIEEIKIR